MGARHRQLDRIELVKKGPMENKMNISLGRTIILLPPFAQNTSLGKDTMPL